MPPKRASKAAAPAKPALDGCKLVLSGTFPGNTHASIKAMAEALGATVATTVTDDATHLVASEADYNKPSPKVSKAQSLGIHIVGLDWLSLCEQNNTKEPEAGHLLGTSAQDDDEPAQADASKPASSQVNGTAAAAATGRSRKRAIPAADNASDTEAAPKAKKTKGRKAAAAKADANEDVEMKDANGVADAQPEEEETGKGKGKGKERAMGEGQLAKSKDMQIPLDEGCPFSTSRVYIDDAGVIYDASLNQTNASNNNNKFYRIQVSRQPWATPPLGTTV